MSEPSTTNNRMALRSVIEGVRAVSTKRIALSIVFTSDSRYLINGLRDWVHGWARRGWTSKGGAIENLALWREAITVLRAVGHQYDWRWVRGHDGHPQNEYANHLGDPGRGCSGQLGGLVPSGFDAWLAELASRARHPSDEPPDAFPGRELLRPGARASGPRVARYRDA